MVLAAAIVGFAPGLLDPFHAFKAIVLRLIGLPLLAWVVTEILLRRMRLGAQAFAVLAWVAACGLSTAFSLSPRLSILGELSQREGLLTAIALSGLHLAAAHAHRSEAQVRTTLTVMLGAGVLAAAYALIQVAGLDPIRWQGMQYASEGAIALRPAGPLGNPILLGAVLAAMLPMVLVCSASPQGDATRLVPAAALVAAAVLMTLSRGAWLAAAAGTIAGLALARLAGARLSRVAWTAAASLAPALVLGATRAPGAIAQRIAEGVHGSSLATRELIARAAWQLFRERPLLGLGPDAFGLAFPRVQGPEFWRAEWIGTPVHAHAVPLEILATLGLAGALAGLAWLVTAGAAWVRAWRKATTARFTLAAIAGSLAALAVAGVTNVVGLAGATLFAVLTALAPAVEERPEPAAPQRKLGFVGAALVFLFSFAPSAREFRAFTLARAAQDGPTRARIAWSAAKMCSKEESLWRLACDISLAEADALGPDGGMASVVAAEHAAREALALVPARAASHERLGRALAARALRTGAKSTADSADASFERATQLAPADGWLLVSWIRVELARRDGERARELSRRLVALYPEAAVGHALSGAALLLLDRPGEALFELQRAQGARWEEDAGAQRAEVDRLVAEIRASGKPGS